MRRFSRRNPAASRDAISSRRSSMDMSAGSSRCMGAPQAVAHNDLRFAAGELSGGGGSTLRVNSVLLHYLPPTSSKCLIQAAKDGGTVR